MIRGNHRDAWVFGASDPLSGNVAMLSEAKALGGLWKQGWRPERTIVYASWDAEEPMLLGSTEWAEEHAAELKAKAIIYINTDGNGRGFLGAGGAHGFQHLVNAVAADVTDPQTGRERGGTRPGAAARAGVRQDRPGERRETLAAARKGRRPADRRLGVGLRLFGLSAASRPRRRSISGFGGEDESGGVYHSIYDSYHHFTTFDDPGLLYGAALVARLWAGRCCAWPMPRRCRSASGISPIRCATYLGEVKKLAEAIAARRTASATS